MSRGNAKRECQEGMSNAGDPYVLIKIIFELFTVPSAILEMQPRTRENEAGVDSR